ncbi:HSP20-like chaperone [Rhizopogon vinicolor AM-OR11-026]|uniref:HSP20-like chaperone n=1 Tax=Rhizopogon vinicolor AM-OR11-026 TaxID=1314800 RepID=A0A1B7MSE7_9AGAM|nr:HSP20-like chaperone [Rhizopogon vinicolor AM-OR11-026]
MSLSFALYNPFTEFDKLFVDAFSARFRPTTTSNGGGMDLRDNPETKTMTATFELPGLKSEDVAVEVHSKHLTISGESKRSEQYDKAGYAFSRSLHIPQGIKAEDVQAKMENGVLTVYFPKVAPDQQPKRIAIA